MTPASGSAGDPRAVTTPASAPITASHRRLGRVVVVAVGLAVAVAVSGSGGGTPTESASAGGSQVPATPQATADPGAPFASSDGAFSMTIPSTWADRTRDYRTDYLNENRQVSSLDGMVTLDGLPSSSSANFVTMSARSRADIVDGVTASDIGMGEVERWRSTYVDSTLLPEETFTSEAGDSVWMGGLAGTIDGHEGQIVIATALGDQWSATFALRVDGEHGAARDDLRGALATLAFSPDPAPGESANIFAASGDGRTSSSKDRATIVIPTTWTHVAVDADRDAFLGDSDFDSLGTWRVAEGDGTFSPTVSFIASDKTYPTPSSVTEMMTRYPKVGTSRVDDAGVTYTTLAFGVWSARGDDTAGWAESRAEYPADVAAGRGPLVTERRCYLMVSNVRELVACVETLPGEVDAQAPGVEAALGTVRFDDEG